MSEKEIEARARRLGARRSRHKQEGAAIREAITEITSDAEGVISRQRLADLLGLHRGSLYDQFIGGSSDDEAGKGAATQASA